LELVLVTLLVTLMEMQLDLLLATLSALLMEQVLVGLEHMLAH
jgi:hypothetical protein